MKHCNYILAIALVLAGSAALAQMQQPGMGQPPSVGGQQPGAGTQGPLGGIAGQPTQQHIPGVGEPGMGGAGQLPGNDPQQNTTKQTKAPTVDDDTLLRQVHEQLATSNDFNYVKISVKNGIVMLEGVVPRKEDRKQAKQLAESVPGVRGVKEKLSVGPTGTSANAASSGGTSGGISGTGSANPETTNHTAGSIAGNASAASGTAANTASRGQAGASTSSAPSSNPGTTPGSNAGTPPASTVGTTLSDSASLQGELQAAFKNDPNLKNDGLVANVTDDSIELTGTVANGKDRQAAKSIAESYAGNRKVIDHITIK